MNTSSGNFEQSKLYSTYCVFLYDCRQLDVLAVIVQSSVSRQTSGASSHASVIFPAQICLENHSASLYGIFFSSVATVPSVTACLQSECAARRSKHSPTSFVSLAKRHSDSHSSRYHFVIKFTLFTLTSRSFKKMECRKDPRRQIVKCRP